MPQGWAQQACWLHLGGISLAREPLAFDIIKKGEPQCAALLITKRCFDVGLCLHFGSLQQNQSA